MKKTLVITGIAGLLMLAGGRVEAYSLTPTSTTCTSSTNLNLGEIYDLLSTCFGGVNIPEDEFHKLYRNDGVEEGAYAPSYNTSFSNTPQDPSIATITYVNPYDAIVCFECYLAVKAGKTTYYYDLSGWDGEATLEVTGFGGSLYSAISGVTIYGVPEPATILLLVTGVGLLALRRRREVA